jgi:membrane protein required for colicin V production
MNALDLLIILPVGYFAYKGFTAGLIQEVLGILGIIIAVFVSFAYMKPVSVWLEPFFAGTDTPIIVAGLILFIGTIIIVQLIGHAIRTFLEIIKLNFINRIAGLFFGALKSAIVISAFLWLFAGFNIPEEETRNESLLYPAVLSIAPAVFNMVASIYPGIENFIETLEDAIQEDNPIRNNQFFDRNHL